MVFELYEEMATKRNYMEADSVPYFLPVFNKPVKNKPKIIDIQDNIQRIEYNDGKVKYRKTTKDRCGNENIVVCDKLADLNEK